MCRGMENFRAKFLSRTGSSCDANVFCEDACALGEERNGVYLVGSVEGDTLLRHQLQSFLIFFQIV